MRGLWTTTGAKEPVPLKTRGEDAVEAFEGECRGSARRPDIALVIPARNEELCLPGVLAQVPPEVTRVVLADNGSTDATARVGAALGAEVVSEPIAGYGRACLAGLAALRHNPPDLVAFVDADGSDDLSRLPELIAPILAGSHDLVLGRRVPVEKGALSCQQRFGHLLATSLIRLFWGQSYRDLGPMRVIGWESLQRLAMQDQGFGWTVEMQVRAVKQGLRMLEIDVDYRRRSAGKSKISRTISGTLRAGSTILWVIGRELLQRAPKRNNERIASAVAAGAGIKECGRCR